ncbi:hypothetical protein C1646_778057 [Rhizophagus diaphanus]|nr:hypothetical protein C1646_778057 [Rhizophagus diaphanus] [Rhizophagus sp. MUCL 43196]
MAELRDQVSQYIGFEPNEIRLPITEEDRHNGKGGEFIHIGWLLACTVAQAKKVLINPPERQAERDLSEKPPIVQSAFGDANL